MSFDFRFGISGAPSSLARTYGCGWHGHGQATGFTTHHSEHEPPATYIPSHPIPSRWTIPSLDDPIAQRAWRTSLPWAHGEQVGGGRVSSGVINERRGWDLELGHGYEYGDGDGDGVYCVRVGVWVGVWVYVGSV